MTVEYQFSNFWFEENAAKIWKLLLPKIMPRKYLELGSYEGKSICYFIANLGNENDLEVHAVDSWQGGTDVGSKHLMTQINMKTIEERFDFNTNLVISGVAKKIDLIKHKGFSDEQLCAMIPKYKNYFDFIYVDGSHETNDTLCDMILAFKLLKEGGVMGVDDALWHVDHDVIYRPKIAIDTFVNMNLHRLDMIQTDNSQVYFVKRNHLDENGKRLPVNIS